MGGNEEEKTKQTPQANRNTENKQRDIPDGVTRTCRLVFCTYIICIREYLANCRATTTRERDNDREGEQWKQAEQGRKKKKKNPAILT